MTGIGAQSDPCLLGARTFELRNGAIATRVPIFAVHDVDDVSGMSQIQRLLNGAEGGIRSVAVVFIVTGSRYKKIGSAKKCRE